MWVLFISYKWQWLHNCLNDLAGAGFLQHLDVMQAIAHDERLDPEVALWLQSIIMSGLENEGMALLSPIRNEQELRGDNDDNIDIVDDNFDNSDEVQVKEAAVEPQVHIEVNQPVETEDLLPGGSRKRTSEEDDEGDGRGSKQSRY